MVIDKKCAPSKKYVDGSCIPIQYLIDIVTKWNNNNKNNQIILSNDKKKLIKQLDKKLSNKCSNQACWLKLDFIKNLKNFDLLNNTLRPDGPEGKYEWLSTTDIDNVINQYQTAYEEFVFLGAVPYDFDTLKFLGINNLDFKKLEESGTHKIGLVINLDEHYKSGSHWVGLYTDLQKKQIYFFDSVGKKPRKRIKKFINRIIKYLYHKTYGSVLDINDIYNKLKQDKHTPEATKLLTDFDIRYNNIQHQFRDSECGVYSIHFITRLVEGETFDSIINNVIRDEKMNSFRKEYFINVN
jgi:hypothetical protein